MPKLVPVTAEDVEWLRQAVAEGITYSAMAERLNCHVDTLKRILQRNDIVHFPGAKYQKRRGAELQMWTRPCSGCRSTEPRPKWIYYCDACARRLGHARSVDDW